MRIGDFLVEKKVLNKAQVQQILDHAKTNRLRFGEAALELGILDEEKMIRIFGRNYSVDFFHLDPNYFPKETREVLSPDFMLKYGALALGFKTEYRFFKPRRVLNIGLLDPGQKQTIREVEEAAEKSLGSEAFAGVKIFLILADQFLDVVNAVYSINELQIGQRPTQEVDKTLALFLGEQ